MKIGGKHWLRLAGIFVMVIVLFTIWWGLRYIIYLPYLWERLRARPAATPEEAYEKFRAAVAEGKEQEFLSYIVREKRSHYRQILTDPTLRQHYSQPLQRLMKEYIIDCEDQLACRSRALYSYEYEVTEAYWEEINGQRFLVPAGSQRLEMVFMEIKPGYWQISEL